MVIKTTQVLEQEGFNSQNRQWDFLVTIVKQKEKQKITFILFLLISSFYEDLFLVEVPNKKNHNDGVCWFLWLLVFIQEFIKYYRAYSKFYISTKHNYWVKYIYGWGLRGMSRWKGAYRAWIVMNVTPCSNLQIGLLGLTHCSCCTILPSIHAILLLLISCISVNLILI